MKHLISVLLAILLLSGCAGQESSVCFYYRQRELAYGSEQSVIATERREAPGHETDLEYLLQLYLEGPLDPGLIAPFPEGTALEGFSYSDATLFVTLTQDYAALDDMDHTVASACIAYTCFELTSAETVVIKCNSPQHGNKSITLTRDSMVLADAGTAPAE